jgi:uncharacterized protein YyaL (SSP411 family)
LNKTKNHLENEKSPYLIQHVNNPVDWYPWTDEAFELAKEKNKPIFLSIGYSTCHWCHVMARESFEDSEVAKLLNENFICIKVDREERPDIDNIYMTVCQIMTGSGGWPLTIILTPDKRPFFAATYIPKNNRFGRAGLMELIPQIRDLWDNKKIEVNNLANQLNVALENFSQQSTGEMLGEDTIKQAYDQLKDSFDKSFGGFGKHPKFPMPHNLFFLLRYWKKYNDKDALDMVKKTLDNLRNGGIYDHIGYGFHRYSTDDKWFIPHFEKMLYDQALISIAYIEAFQETGDSLYATTAQEILDYVLMNMTSPEGGFYSAEDADSEGQEGKFYTWSYEELVNILNDGEFNLVKDLFNIDRQGNFSDEATATKTGQNILFQTVSLNDFFKRKKIEYNEIRDIFKSARKKLFDYREKRIHPYKDDKILVDWNGLMIAAFAKASQAFNDDKYSKAAESAVNFIIGKMTLDDGGLYHRYRAKESAIQGNFNDYAFFIFGLINLYQSTFNIRYLQHALKLNNYMFDHFWDKSNNGFYFSSDNSKDLLVRTKEIYDGAIPSGNSIALLNLLQLSKITADTEMEKKVSDLIKAFSSTIKKIPSSFSQFMSALLYLIDTSYVIVVAGKATDASEIFNEINQNFIPNKILIFRPTDQASSDIIKIAKYVENYYEIDGRSAIYVCSNYACKSPFTDVKKAINSLKEK